MSESRQIETATSAVCPARHRAHPLTRVFVGHRPFEVSVCEDCRAIIWRRGEGLR